MDPTPKDPNPAEGPHAGGRLRSAASRAAAAVRRLGARRLALAALGAAALCALAVAGLAVAWTWELPEFEGLRDYRPLVATRVYAADGSEAFAFARERRTVVPFEQIPDVMKRAVLAAEDARFYEHEGVNYLAIGRCAVKGFLRGGVACGGSTITQQVVKTFLLSTDWRVKRKVKELVLAPRLEKNLSKDEILYLYLNQIYLGHRRYGVEEASRFYFGKSVKDLSVGEAALVAGLVQSPERLSPFKHPDAARARQRYVLRRMVEEGFLDPRVAEAEAAKPLRLRRPAEPYGAWYADAVRRYLDERYGAERVETDGLVVDVAMLPSLQRAAEAAIDADLRLVDKRHGWRGAPQHLDEEQLARAMPAWRERLASAKAGAGEVLAWDLGRVDPEEIEPGGELSADARRRVRTRPLEAGEVYAALVVRVDDRDAELDLGNARGVIPFSDVSWARKYNPAVATTPPRRMGDVLRPGDIVLVRVLPAGRRGPADLARAGKPLTLSLEQTPRLEGALVAIDPSTRGVRALVGGYDFGRSQFNRALQAKRQPGSAFKPFVWGAAIESRKFTPATVVYDTPDLYRDPWTNKEWKPQNFEKDSYDGPMLLKDALAHSKNTVSAKLVNSLGVDAVIDFARRAGISSELPRSLSLALGTGEVTPLELVNAYASLAAQGFYSPPIIVTRVRDREGRVLEENRPVPIPPAPPPPPPPPGPADGLVPASADAVAALPGAPPPAAGAPPTAAPPAPAEAALAAAPASEPPAEGPPRIRPETAFVVLSMMKEVVQSGTGQAARALERPVAAKTGTAQEHRDAWFVGMTPELVAGVWVGFDSHDPLGAHATGAGAALPGWLGFMQAAVGMQPPSDFPPPAGVEVVAVDPRTGLLARPGAEGGASTVSLPFVAGTAPAKTAPDPSSSPQNFFQDDR
ncbi:MAG TPA: PBP1A family penicillin-binding protein [Anaeromyxobacteraceae bacterium]|nr:PBP1A family penicillin-binding protein [Anaeromyxobacteraceae bacterium]